MKEIVAVIFGLGLVCNALLFVPQAIAVWRRAPMPVPDVSLTTYIVLAFGISGWILYGIRISSFAVKLWNIITLCFAFSILAYKVMYG